MLKWFITLVTVFALASGVVAQNKKLSDVKRTLAPDKEVVNNNYVGAKNLPTKFEVKAPATGDTVGYSTYDYFTNSLIRDQIVYNGGKIHLVPMLRQLGSTKRVVTYVTTNASNQYVKAVPFDSTGGNSGWPHIDVSLTGANAGTMAVVAHHVVGAATVSRLAIWDGAAFVNPVQFDPNTDPSIQFVGDTIFLGTSGNRIQYKMYKSVDLGTSFSYFDSIGRYSPRPIWWVENGGVELGMSKSYNEKYLVYFGTNSGIIGGGNHAYNGTSEDSCDNIWYILSTDRGRTFTGKRVAVDGKAGLITGYHTPGFAPLFENFGQMDVSVDNNGVVHMVANGYGLDTLSGNAQFPVIYWNSRDNKWISLSQRAIDTLSNLAGMRPGNGIGQSYPNIAATPDGNTVYVTWTGPQMTSGVMDTANNFFKTDGYHSYSTDGGRTWTYGGAFLNKKTTNENFVHPAQFLRVSGNTATADLIYMEDNVPGVAVLNTATALSANPIVYKTVANLPYNPGVGVNDGNGVVNSFELGQNYPNPFNPSTKITFSVPEKGNVSLKVFDVLGREVATLVNGVVEAGSQSVSFDASKLANGLYVYTLKAGNFTASKKMMLVK